MRSIVPTCFLPTILPIWLGIFSCGPALARETRIHGPVLQWHRDPTTSVTFVWVERLTPNVIPPAVWREGRSGFGFGDQGDGTRVDELKNRHSRLFLSKEFSVTEDPGRLPLLLKVDYDDAFVAYINGIEVARSKNLKAQYLDAKVLHSHESGDPELFTLKNPEVYLRRGTNVISIESHNIRKSSRDFTTNPVLWQGGTELIPEGSTWRYLAGADPGSRWFLALPEVVPETAIPFVPDSAIAEKSGFNLKIRIRGSGAVYRTIDIEDRAFGETKDRVFSARAESLSPGASYEYKLSSGGRTLRNGWFRTAPATQRETFQFVAGGDMGTTTAIPVCKLAGKLDPMFALVGGDLAYANGRDEYKWFDWIDNWTEYVTAPDGRQIPMIMGIGNHEMKGLRVRKKDAPFYYSFFDLPIGDSNFTVDFGKYMSIVLLDSNHSRRVRSQNLWLNVQLGSRKNLPHLFCIYHRPGWGTGIKRNSRDVQVNWSPIFERYGVDCVFENDHHVYKRSFKITGGVRDDDTGILYIGDGAWGARLREITPEMIRKAGAERYLAKWESVHHLVQVTVNVSGSKEYKAMTADGRTFDQFFDAHPTTAR